MKVVNRTAYAIVVFVHDLDSDSYGEDVTVEPGEMKEIQGPDLDVAGEGECPVNDIKDELICHSHLDDGMSFRVVKGKPKYVVLTGCIVTIRHFEDEPEPEVKQWRARGDAVTPSYCLDVVVGYQEGDRQELIAFLALTGQPFEIGQLQRGMWQGTKILRIETSNARGLQSHIYGGLLSGDDYQYVIHDTYVDARRSMTWLPDFDTKYGYEPFDFAENQL
jgi:hypothetical protein